MRSTKAAKKWTVKRRQSMISWLRERQTAIRGNCWWFANEGGRPEEPTDTGQAVERAARTSAGVDDVLAPGDVAR